ncbi:MAG: hypothetical protein ACRD3D_11110 [Terriglobia bacterium]
MSIPSSILSRPAPSRAFSFVRWIAALALVFTAAPACATSLVRLSLDQLTEASSAVVQGHVVSQSSQWNAAHTEIITLTTVAVDANAKGNTPATIVVEQLGGTVGRVRVAVPGTMHFFPQARYELFLQPSEARPSHYLLVGMRQGSYRIYQDPRTHQERVINPVGGTYGRQAGAGELPATMPLHQFQQRISSAVSKPLVIPRETALPLLVRSVSFAGAGRIQVEASTSADVYPDAHTVIPAGSLVDGWGEESDGTWTVHWTGVSTRGARARISALSRLGRAGSLSEFRGERLTVITR